jgi:hypothetical protein
LPVAELTKRRYSEGLKYIQQVKDATSSKVFCEPERYGWRL